MIQIDSKYIDRIDNATSMKDLHLILQNAIELEHATIPTYLTAMISIKPGTNQTIKNIFHSVVIEEMLHMSIACNILNALGGSPDINTPAFVPKFPGPLPMGINSGLIVSLVPISLDAIKNIYMEIEEPEDPLNFPVKSAAVQDVHYATIGQFYDAIKKKINILAPDILPGDPSKQMTEMFPSDEIFPILTKNDACRAIDIIVEQGEGTTHSPLDPEGELAHYYRFAEIYHGKELVADSTEPLGYSYSGSPIVLDSAGVHNIQPDTKLNDLPAGSEAYRAASEFSQAYSRLLNALHTTFNGAPDTIKHTIGMMYDVKLLGETMAAMPFPGKTGVTVGPTFEYMPLIP